MLHLTISMRMWDGRQVHTDVVFVAKLQELPANKLGPVVGDDGIRYPEPVDDIGKERHGLLRTKGCDWAYLDPFRATPARAPISGPYFIE
jgi:hypothetical protein